MRTVTRIVKRSEKIQEALRLAVVSDLHNESFDDVKENLAECDAILVPGDLVNRHSDSYDQSLRFLKEAPDIAPVFYSIGNHERRCRFADRWREIIRESRVTLLDNNDTFFRGIWIGGLTSTANRRGDRAFLERFEKENGFRLLLCHHPEMYRDDVAERDVDLTLCGHAHGGQVRIFGQGLFAPDQGLFPKLTSGWYDGEKMFVSRGMANKSKVPRINNPCELIVLELRKE